jgi:hypothetical protein
MDAKEDGSMTHAPAEAGAGSMSDMSGRLGSLLIVVTGVVWAALRCWPLQNCCTDCVIPV